MGTNILNPYLDSKPIWFSKGHKKMSNFWLVTWCYMAYIFVYFLSILEQKFLNLGSTDPLDS